jgi:hypothetical protein
MTTNNSDIGPETLGNKQITPVGSGNTQIQKPQKHKESLPGTLVGDSFVPRAYTKRHQVPTQKCINKEKYI